MTLRRLSASIVVMIIRNAYKAKALNYQEELIKRLRDPEHSLAYLNAALMEEDPKLFLIALRNVLEAHGSINVELKACSKRHWNG